MIEKKVDEHAGHGHIHPQRERPLRDAAVLRHAHLQTVPDGEDRQRQNDHGENRVRREDRQVQRPPPTRPRKPRDHAPAQGVVRHVADEKEHRGAACGEHEPAVLGDALRANVAVSDEEQDAARGVERREEVDRGHREESISFFVPPPPSFTPPRRPFIPRHRPPRFLKRRLSRT